MTINSHTVGDLAVSVVSHGHGPLLRDMLHGMARRCRGSVTRVVLTLNVPEPLPTPPDEAGWPFVLEVRSNPVPLGFGANHNRALAGAGESYVGVVNPDIAFLDDDPFAPLCRAAAAPGVGCAYPEQVDGQGAVQDAERELPTPSALWRRRVLKRSDRRRDWVNAAFLLFPTPAWKAAGGFDERYFMYCEDVDLCLRLRLQGLSLVKVPVQVGHVGQRASRRRGAHLAWHIRSLFRLWASPVYRQARALLRADTAEPRRIGAP
ncbi:glycosyl transferase [Acidovorax sp. NCPPB 4044]|uniref:glycosyl transferase n=1 Tax=Acidovorax sp. NCPPB 4044 TaxID=2940490 RepID=UPI0023027E88|nr:glycosyl transferase [Acidovorax sp. NCPPB 4044]MDA8522488.1 glycosyl transferase [Acidovorax sp. NCPPB 4044]